MDLESSARCVILYQIRNPSSFPDGSSILIILSFFLFQCPQTPSATRSPAPSQSTLAPFTAQPTLAPAPEPTASPTKTPTRSPVGDTDEEVNDIDSELDAIFNETESAFGRDGFGSMSMVRDTLPIYEAKYIPR
jgi:hypothetical protein